MEQNDSEDEIRIKCTPLKLRTKFGFDMQEDDSDSDILFTTITEGSQEIYDHSIGIKTFLIETKFKGPSIWQKIKNFFKKLLRR
ncbi:hypothetical protein LCGC14_0454040 [marine sediment metagenome]|uniref:Uncharacterized protein n=1 Tax=marine sediment metagenome TaxID=412755 RepID=A0A0F9SM50_9ZZZZ